MKKRLAVAKALVVPVVAAALVSQSVYDDHSLTSLSLELAGYALLVAAMVGRIWAAAFISGMKEEVLVTVGPYSIVRNPLYLFSLLGFVGAGLALGSLVLAFVFGCVFFLTHWATILKEERKLRENFGEAFDEYVRAVPRFVPRFSSYRVPEELPLKPRIFSRAMADCTLIGLIFPLTQILQWLQAHGYAKVFFRLP